MDVDSAYIPVAQTLIDATFGVPVVYQRRLHGGYDPATGLVTETTTDYNIKAAVLSAGRTEQGGTQEDHELRLWIHHGAGGLPVAPLTGDRVQYLGGVWKVTVVDPSYSSKALIASKIACKREP